MSAVYLAYLGIFAGLGTLLVASLLGVQQILVQRTSSRVAGLVHRHALLISGAVLFGLALLMSLLGAVLLSGRHDLLPGNLGVDKVLGHPLAALANAAIAGAGTTLGVIGVSRGLRLLDPWQAAARVLKAGRWGDWTTHAVGALGTDLTIWDVAQGVQTVPEVMLAAVALHDGTDARTQQLAAARRETILSARTSADRGQLTDPLGDAGDIGLRALEGRDDDALARIARLILERSIAHVLVAEAPAIPTQELRAELSRRLFSEIQRISDRAIDSGYPAAAAVVARAVTDSLAGAPLEAIWAEGQGLTGRIARQCLAARSRAPLSATIGAVADQASRAVADPLWQERYDRAARVLGNLGEQLPSIFRNPDEPEVLFTTDDEGVTDPLNALIDAFYRVGDQFTDHTDSTADPFIGLQAMQRTGVAIAERTENAYGDRRLERELVMLRAIIARVGISAAKSENAHTAFAAALALGELAERAYAVHYHELPTDLAGDLAEIGFLAETHDLHLAGGPDVAEWIAGRLVTTLDPELDQLTHELIVAGRYAYGDANAVRDFIRRLQAGAGRDFGLTL